MALRKAILTVLLAAGICGVLLRADDQPRLEYRVKAAFLLNFTKFVEWPAEAFENSRSPFRICLFGNDPFGGVIDQMVKGEGLNGRPLVVSRISRMPEPKACQVLFVNRVSTDDMKALAPLRPGVLTVGEGHEFVRDGGVIAFVVENRRVRFDISQRAATSEMLTISSHLLSVARSVEK